MRVEGVRTVFAKRVGSRNNSDFSGALLAESALSFS